MRRLTWLTIVLVTGFGCGCHNDTPRAASAQRDSQLAASRDSQQRANQVNSDRLQLVAGINGPMPTGIAVSKAGRIFVNFPRWGDPVEFTVAELKDGKPVAYPN